MDFGNPLGIEYRVVSDIEHDGQPARCVSGARTYDTHINDLWDAVTSPERIPRWFLPVTGQFELGGRYQLKGHAGGEILRCDPPEALDVTWEYSKNVSWVQIRLEAEGKGTRLTLQHIMGKDDASEEHWTKFGPGATGVGWELGFMGLGLHLSSGETVEQKDAEAWMASDEGKQFIRDSSVAWGDAHIAAGEESDVAKAMANETASAYTGEA